jgi:hypothetical protein
VIPKERQRRESELRFNPLVAAEAQRMQIACEEYGQSAAFPVSQRGSVRECPPCGAEVDVVEDDGRHWGEMRASLPTSRQTALDAASARERSADASRAASGGGSSPKRD